LKKLIFALVILLVCYSSGYADKWEKALDLNLTLTQNSYSDSWVGGEAGSVSWMANSNFKAAKQLSPKLNWSNTLKLAFGQTHQQEQETKQWRKPFKSTDLIDITLSESAGASKEFYKTEETEFLSRVGFGLRQMINREIVDTLQEKTETRTTNDGGFESVTDFKASLAQGKISYSTKLTLFKAIFYSESDELQGTPQQDYWKSVDVNWENILSASITKYLTVNLYFQFLYDKEIDLKGRFKETLALGLTYRLF